MTPLINNVNEDKSDILNNTEEQIKCLQNHLIKEYTSIRLLYINILNMFTVLKIAHLYK
jgi:hypothetical protein